MALGGALQTIAFVLTLFVLQISTSSAACTTGGSQIYIYGWGVQVLEGGTSYYNDRSVCQNTAGMPYCAAQIGCLDGSTVSISGIPLNCNTATGRCSITAPTAVCATTANCNNYSLVVNGVPAIQTIGSVTGIGYNMGNYTIQYSAPGATSCVNASFGSTPYPTIPCSRLVIVRDTIPPIIYLNGSSLVNMEGGGTYNESGAIAVDAVDGNMPFFASPVCAVDATTGRVLGNASRVCRINLNNPTVALNVYVVGSQNITYVAADTSGNQAITTRRIVLTDTTPPVLTVNNCTSDPCLMTWEGATPYMDPGAKAVDIVDGNVSVARSIRVNTRFIGQYNEIYNTHDKAMNAAPSRRRIVTVMDTRPPTLVLLGNSTIYVEGATPYIEPFAVAYDTMDGEITANIQMDVTRRTPMCTKSTGCTTLP